MERIVKAVDGVGVNFTMAAAALSLSQIYVETNHAAEAVKLLEDPKIGPLTLVEAKNPLTAEGTFAIETCKAALRAYAATKQLDKAEKVMNALEAAVAKSGDDKGNQTLIAIYRSLGQELENHVAALRKENRTDDLQAVSNGLDAFLTQVADKKTGNNFNSLNWVAETYSRLGTAHEGEDDSVSPSAANTSKNRPRPITRFWMPSRPTPNSPHPTPRWPWKCAWPRASVVVATSRKPSTS